EAMGAIERDVSPLGIETVYPVEAAEGVGDANGEMVFAAGLGCGSQVGFKGKLFHDGVAAELAIEIDLGPQVCTADVQEDSLAVHGGRNLDVPVPPRDAEVGTILRDVVVRRRAFGVFGVAIFFRRVGPTSVLAPEVLFHTGW